MKLNQVGSNQTELIKDNGEIVLFSYNTPVAIYIPHKGALCTKTKYSTTTTRHIHKALIRWNCDSIFIEQSEID